MNDTAEKALFETCGVDNSLSRLFENVPL